MSTDFITREHTAQLLLLNAAHAKTEIFIALYKIEIPISKKIDLFQEFLSLLCLRSKQRVSVNILLNWNKQRAGVALTNYTAAKELIKSGVNCRFLQSEPQHSKAFIFDNSTLVITSANLSSASLFRNIETGLITSNQSCIKEAKNYYGGLWKKATSF